MSTSDPKQVIIDHLMAVRMPVQVTSNHNKQEAAFAEERLVTRTFRFLKERTVANYHLSIVAIEDQSGQEILFTNNLIQDQQGNWHLHDTIGDGSERNVFEYNQPRLKLAAGGWPDHFFASGYVSGHNHQQIQRVHLISSNGVHLEDIVENGVVLFLTEQKINVPFKANLYNSANELVNSHKIMEKAFQSANRV